MKMRVTLLLALMLAPACSGPACSSVPVPARNGLRLKTERICALASHRKGKGLIDGIDAKAGRAGYRVKSMCCSVPAPPFSPRYTPVERTLASDSFCAPLMSNAEETLPR